MTRQPKPPKQVGEQVAFDDFVAPEAKRSKPRTMSKEEFKKLLIATNGMKDNQNWNEFTPKNFVALYCLLHNHVYGVLPDEVRAHYRQAVGKAMLMLKNEFSGDPVRMVDFIRWVWGREMKRNACRGPDDDFRIGWRLQFAPTYLSDYRVARARRGKRVQ